MGALLLAVGVGASPRWSSTLARSDYPLVTVAGLFGTLLLGAAFAGLWGLARGRR